MNFLNKAILGNLTGTQAVGIGGYTLEVRIKDQMDLKAKATTAYIEDGGFVVDHIVNDPVMLSLEGEIANVIIQPPIEKVGQSSAYSSNTFLGFLPPRTPTQVNAISEYVDIVSSVAQGDTNDLYALFQGVATVESVGSSFIRFIKDVRDARALIAVETTLGSLQNMAVTGCTFTKVDSNYMTYTISLQEIRFASIQTTQVSQIAPSPTGDAKTQTQPTNNKGTISGDSVPSNPQATGENAESNTQESILHSLVG